VAYDAVLSARSKDIDTVIIDTAGRLHTKTNLMEELKKIKRVIGKEAPSAPHEVLLVIDATSGQNAITQVKMFNEAVGVTGIALTKLDGTAKGGIILAINKELDIPVKLIGVGEGVDDLQDFNAEDFVNALFE
jgi:fused signal recognition particle receptor